MMLESDNENKLINSQFLLVLNSSGQVLSRKFLLEITIGPLDIVY